MPSEQKLGNLDVNNGGRKRTRLTLGARCPGLNKVGLLSIRGPNPTFRAKRAGHPHLRIQTVWTGHQKFPELGLNVAIIRASSQHHPPLNQTRALTPIITEFWTIHKRNGKIHSPQVTTARKRTAPGRSVRLRVRHSPIPGTARSRRSGFRSKHQPATRAR